MQSEKSVVTKMFKLNNNVQMPAVGLGTFRMKKADIVMNAVDHALAAGYRMFDTAAVYYNEHHLNVAFQSLLPKYGLKRKDIFITTKLAPADLNRPLEACMKSLKNLGVDYVDLYLIHFPGNLNQCNSKEKNAEYRQIAWQGLVEIYKAGKARAIGVSNYTLAHLKELMTNNYGVIPAVNQVEWHPYYYQMDLLDYCKEMNIVLQAYSSLGTSENNGHNSILHDQTVDEIAKKLNVSNAQLLLAWALQQNVAIIPKSTNPNHILHNSQLNFIIPTQSLMELNDLGKKNIKYTWNPNDV